MSRDSMSVMDAAIILTCANKPSGMADFIELIDACPERIATSLRKLKVNKYVVPCGKSNSNTGRANSAGALIYKLSAKGLMWVYDHASIIRSMQPIIKKALD